MVLDQVQTISLGERIAEIIFPKVRERRQDLEREASVDGLTGLSNRTAFDKARAGAEANQNTCFIVFDCNNFGRVNKSFGHAFGDEVLSIIAADIRRAAVANRARAFRFGGDEFVVITDWRRGELLRDAIEKRVGTFDFDNFHVSISGSIASTFGKADERLQRRKMQRKAA